MSNTYYVYIITNKTNTVLYTGVTNNLKRRLFEHKEKKFDGFTCRYNVNKLVYFESTSDINVAIAREKEIKGWKREKKNALVETKNKNWSDLTAEWSINNS